jgi:hypothetical protein
MGSTSFVSWRNWSREPERCDKRLRKQSLQDVTAKLPEGMAGLRRACGPSAARGGVANEYGALDGARLKMAKKPSQKLVSAP